MQAKYRWIHECEKPKMSRVVAQEVEVRTWWGRKVNKIVHATIWDTRYIVWNCSTCRSDWSWLSSGEESGGFWMCDYRPEVWKDTEL